MRKVIIDENSKKITRLYLELGDEVQTNGVTLRETAFYTVDQNFELVVETPLTVPCSLDGKEMIYLEVEFDDSSNAYVDIPPEYEVISIKDHHIKIKTIEQSTKDWQKEVTENITQLGYKDWLIQKYDTIKQVINPNDWK